LLYYIIDHRGWQPDGTSTPAEKAKFLSQQLEDIRRARALIERFEGLTQKWLKRVEAAQNKA
jgi:hypothetical protein